MDYLTVAMLSGSGGFFIAAMLGAYRLTKQGYRLTRQDYLLEEMAEKLTDANKARHHWEQIAGRQAKTMGHLERSLLDLRQVAYIRHGRSFKHWTPNDA